MDYILSQIPHQHLHPKTSHQACYAASLPQAWPSATELLQQHQGENSAYPIAVAKVPGRQDRQTESAQEIHLHSAPQSQGQEHKIYSITWGVVSVCGRPSTLPAKLCSQGIKRKNTCTHLQDKFHAI
jgi:hypothetical protein